MRKQILLGVIVLCISVGFQSCSNANNSENNDDHDSPSQNSLIEETDEVSLSPSHKVVDAIPDKGQKDGKFIQSYPTGELQVEGEFLGGKRIGVWTAYFLTGNKQSENNYHNGKLDGKSITYYPNGQIMYIGYYSNGINDGQWMFFAEDGTLVKEIIYKNGEVLQENELNEKPTKQL